MQKVILNIGIIGILLVNSFICRATEYEDKIIETSPQRSAVMEKSKFISLTIENDSILTSDDHGYTSGVLLSYFDSGYKPIGISKWINTNAPFITFNENSKISYSLGQNLYTPDHIGVSSEQPNDRPWAAFLYGTIRALTLTDYYVDDLELTLGVIGPAAFGKETQTYVHRIGRAKTPRGWDHQLKNEPGAVLTWGRRKLNVISTQIHPLSLVIEPNFSVSLGNIYTSGEIGATMRIMPITNYWIDTPLLIRPSMPGSSFFYSKKNTFSWYMFLGAQGRAIARNIFLDGNTFRHSASIDKKNFVVDINAGLAVMYEKIRLSYTLIHRTKEFRKQHEVSTYSNLNISYSL